MNYHSVKLHSMSTSHHYHKSKCTGILNLMYQNYQHFKNLVHVSHYCQTNSADVCVKWLPEGQRVVSHKGFALSDQEGAIRSSSLQAVLRQEPFGYLPPIPSCAQLPMEPFLCHVLVHTVGHLGDEEEEEDAFRLSNHNCHLIRTSQTKPPN